MDAIEIEEAALDEEGHLSIRPRLPVAESFEFIWRDASGVRWDPLSRALVASEPGHWQPLALFRQIRLALASEYDCLLVPAPDTRWTRVPLELQAAMAKTAAGALDLDFRREGVQR